MALALHQTPAEKLANLFQSLNWEIRRPRVAPALTTGSYIGFSEEYETTVVSAHPNAIVPQAYVMPTGITGDSVAAAGYRDLLPSQTSSDRLEAEMELLLSLAAAGNEGQFASVVQAIDWTQRPPEAVIAAIQLALSTGAHTTARRLAVSGAERYPDRPDLQKYARILAPPRLVQRGLPTRPDLYTNREWIRQHAGQYRGQWVALRNGQLLATADSFEALANQFADHTGILLTRLF